MAQNAYAWLTQLQPASSTDNDPFADIPVSSQTPANVSTSSAAVNDPFADIPVTGQSSSPTVSDSENKYWGQMRAGAYELAKNYYGNEARKKAEQWQQLDQQSPQPGPGFIGRPGLLGGRIIAPQQKESSKEQLKQSIADDLVKARSYGSAAGNIPQLPSVQKFMSGESGQGWWEDFKENPVEIALGITARSAPASMVSMGAGVIGGLATGSPVGAMMGAGSTSGRMEYISSIMQGLEEQGIDWTDPDAFINAVSNEELMEPVKEKALKRGIAIGSFDSLAAMVGGKVLAPKSMLAKSAGKSQLINMPAQMAAQGTLGAGGEAGAQYWSEGEVSDTRGVIAEAIGELTFAPVEAGATLLSVTRGSKGIAEDRLKATNELIDLLVKKRQKAYVSGNREQIEQVSNDLNQYLGIRDDLQKQLNQSDTDTLLQSEQMLQQQIRNTQSKLFTEKDASKRQQMILQLQELEKRRVQVSDELASQNRTRTEPINLSRAQALTDVKLDRELYKQELRKREEEEFQQRMNPMAAANEAQLQAAREGGDALEQQLAASGAYANARSINEMADEAAAEERRVEQEAIDRLWRPLDERNQPMPVNQQQVESGLLFRYLQQEQAEDQAMLQAEQEIADWEATQGITREQAMDQAVQERQQYEEQAQQQRQQQERKQQILQRIDEAVSAGEITPQGEPLARAYADRGIMPPGLSETPLADQINRLEDHISQQEKMVQAQQNWQGKQLAPGTMPQQQPTELTGLLKRDLYRKPEKVYTSEEPVQKTAESIHEPEPVSQEVPTQQEAPKPVTESESEPVSITYKSGQLRWMRNAGKPVMSLDGKDTGWKISQARHAVVLIHPDKDEYQVFPTEGAKDSAERELATMEAVSWAEDHPIVPESESQTTEAKSKPSESEEQTIGVSNNQQITEPEISTPTEQQQLESTESGKQIETTEYGQDFPSVTHTTKKGKTLHGVVDTQLTKEQAKAIDPFSFKKDGGWFIRDFRIGEYNDKLLSGTMEPVHPVEESTDENAERSGEGTLAGEPTEQVSEVPGSGDSGETSGDHTGEGGGHDLDTDGRRIRAKLRGSEEQGLLGTDLHSAGGVSDSETGSGGRGVLQGDVRVGKGREGGVNTGAADYTITEADDLEGESFRQVEKFNHNLEAIRLLKELGDRPATQEQQATLARYVGWGGLKQAFYRPDGSVPKGWEKRAAELKELLTPEEYEAARASTLNAHYTTPTVVNAIYAGLEKLGFTHGRVLEPSVGVGNFFGMMPKAMRGESNLVGVELDTITGGIAKKLYSGARIAAPMGFENFDIAENSFDLVIGNPPFGDETITDLKHKDISGLRIHNYFFAKSMKALRPGGVMAMVVSKGFMDSSKNQKGRDRMFKEARLLGAYRLPNDAFKANANADVTTDIIFLQKRDEPLTGNAPANEPDFRQRAEFTGADGETMQINQYFVENPSKLLGDMIMNKGRFGPAKEPAMVAREGLDWQQELSDQVKSIEGAYSSEKNVQPASTVGKDDASTDLQKAEVEGLYLNDNGELYRRLPDLEGESRGEAITGYVNNKGEEKTFSPKDMEKLKAAVNLARTARNLINSQVKELTDAELQPIREQLNREYDAFVKKYQMLNRPVNKRLLNNGDLTIAPMLLALENSYQKEKKVNGKRVKESSKKADIFTRRTQEPYTEVTKVSSPEEALIVSLAQTGRVDMERMSNLLGSSRTEIASKLTDQIFDDPQQGWVTRDEYLSGNVKLKLRQAREAGRGYEDNVKALEAVQPEDVSPEEIVVTLGASWQTPDVINAFYTHLGGVNPRSAFIPESNFWSFNDQGTTEKSKQWSTDEMGLAKLFNALLNNKPIAVYRTDPATEKRVLDVRATDAATVKAQEIQNEFATWLWKDPQRREAMSRRYNDLMNTHKTRQFDGSFLSFPGKISDDIIKLRRTQANAVWRILQSPTTLLDHVVGAGKTFTMISAAMELKRTGLARKPLIVVPNHLVPQWAEDFARLYPSARVLAAKKENFNTHKRKEMLARIATGDWDAVIMAHTSFGKMPTDTETQKQFLQEQLQDLNRAIEALRKVEDKKSRSVRDAENQKKKLKEKLKKLLDNTAKDEGMTWNETGVDALFVDEAHEFKNLQFYTAMNRVKNINPAGSNKSQDLFIKIRALLQKTGGRNLVFATGTPISNSMAELFTMQRYLAYDQLKDSGLNHFDAWARTFGMVDTKQERKSSGAFGPVSRFSKFVNLPELMTMYRQFADNINNQDIIDALKEEGKGVHIPKVRGGKPTPIVAPRSIYQEAYMGLIEERFANMPDDPSVDNPLKATNDARKAGLDMRMVFPDLPDDPNSKINQGIDNMMRLYGQWGDDKGTQLVFCDLSTPKGAQAKEISQFRKLVAEAAQDDDSGRKSRVNQMTPAELYQYLSAMADEGNQKAQSRLEKVSPDDIEGWISNFDVYNDIKEKLIGRGVPESEIAFIHSANTDLQKEELFAKVNSGEVRFLLGSTAKMGAGTNVQERLVALHHMDAPWRPSDLEQREGRIIRQGNSLFKRDPEGFEVEILRYATEQTYDVNMWQTLEVKARFIEQVRNGDTSQRQAEDVAGESASAAEMKAASSGDPRIMEQVEIAARLKVLDNLRHTAIRDRNRAMMDVERLEAEKQTLPSTIASYQKDLDNTIPLQKGVPQLVAPNGRTFKKAKDAENWLKQSILSQVQDTKSTMWHDGQTIGMFRGLEVKAELYSQFSFEGPVDAVKIWLEGERDYQIISSPLEDVAWGGLFTRFNNTIKDMEYEIEARQDWLNQIDASIAETRKRANAQFKYEEEYQQKNRRNQELIEELGADQEENPQGVQLPEYRALTNVMEDYGNRPTETTADWLGNTAIANRAGKLASSIRHSKSGKEQDAANRAMEQAKGQGIQITKEDLKRAREQLEAANQSQPVDSSKTETTTETETSQLVTEFNDASQAVEYMLEKKAPVTADNGNIRIERSSPGHWQIKVKENPETNDFDDDSIVFDEHLIRLTGKGSTRIGTEQVFSFPENRLASVVRYLYGKVGLQPEQAIEATAEPMPIFLNKGKGKREKTVDRVSMPVQKVQQIADRFKERHPGLKNLEIITLEDTTQLPVLRHSENNPDMGGAYIPGANRVYLFSANLRGFTDVQSVLRHETFVHFAVDALPEDQRRSLIDGILKAVNKNKEIKALYKEIDEHPEYSNRSVELKAEEVFAHLANDEITYARFKRLWFKVRELIRQYLGIDLIRTKSDLEGFIVDFIRRVASGEYVPTTARPRKWRGLVDEIPSYIRKNKDGSASFTAKQGRDQPSRFFNSQALAESQVIKAATRTRSSLMVPVRKLMLPSMGLRQIVDTYERIFAPLAGESWDVVGGVSKGNPISNYQGFVQGMQSLKANKLNDADDIDIDWGKLARKNKKDYETLADIFHRSTLYEVFPDRKEFNAHEDTRKLMMEIAQSKDPEHQAALKKRLMYERERKAEHRKLHERYQALGDPAKKVYKGVEKYYEDMWQDQQKALEEKILRSMHDTDSRQFFLTNLRKKFHEAKVRGPYFPLQRFGPFFLIAEDENGEYYRAHFETEAKLQKEKETLKREGMRILSYGLTPDFTSRKLEGVSQFADEIHLSLDSDKFAKVGQDVKDEIRNEINQLALQLMPDVSAAKHMIRRKKVKGFNENARRAFAYNAIHSSNRLARTKYGDQMSTQLERIRDDIDASNHKPYIPMKDRTIAAQVLSELEKQHEHIMNPKGHPIAARIINLAFIWYLGASAGAGLVNLTQTPLIGIPLMGGRFGYRKTSAAMMKAAKDFAVHGYNKVSLRESVFTLSKAEKGVSNDEKKMLEQLIDDGTIDTTQTSTLAQISDTDLKAEAQTQQDAWVKVNRLLGFFFHNAETANREVTALATYRLAREEGQTHKVAVEQARKMVFDAHFDYSGANRPRVMKNDWMKVFTIFKQYSQNMTYTLIRNFVDSKPFGQLPAREKKAARKALAGILFAHATAAGTLGLPLISWIGPVLAEAFGDDDDEFRDWRTMYRNWLADMFGKQAGEAIAKGAVNAFTGADLHSRVSINELWVRSPNWEMTAREASLHYLTQALGPAVSAGIEFYAGLEQMANGQWKGIEKMVPKFVRDGIRTYRYSTEGATVGREGYMAVVEDFKPWELGLQAFGLAPARLGEAYEARSAVRNMQERLQQRRQELTSNYARAIREGNYQTANETLMAITDFNVANPAFKITPQGLKNSLRMRYRYETLSEQGIYLPQAQMGLLKEARFAL